MHFLNASCILDIRYEYINDVILDHLDNEIKSTDTSGVWRYLISFKVISVHMNNMKHPLFK